MRDITHIVVHCTATKEHQEFSASDINIWHKKKGWDGIGYHYVVKLDGTVENGRPEVKAGAHVAGHNSNTIGVVYVGGYDSNLKPKDTRTALQKASLLKLLKDLKQKYPKAKIWGHRDFSTDLNGNGIIESFEYMKACPCFNAITEYKDV